MGYKKIKKSTGTTSGEGKAPTTYSQGTPPASSGPSLASASQPKKIKVKTHSGARPAKANYHGARSASSSIRRNSRRG